MNQAIKVILDDLSDKILAKQTSTNQIRVQLTYSTSKFIVSAATLADKKWAWSFIVDTADVIAI